jgi:hypothetical protein
MLGDQKLWEPPALWRAGAGQQHTCSEITIVQGHAYYAFD